MVCQPLRLALLIGAITAVAVSPARANFRAPGCCDNPCGSSSACTTAPAYRTVCCTEWVRENYTTTRKAYKVECRTETYDTWRTECVPVVQDRTVCVVKRVPVWTEEVRRVCHKETVYEDRVVNKTCHKYVQETCMKKQLVRLGHWECREVQPLFGGGGGLFGGHGHNDCCDPCASSNACCEKPRCPRTRNVWVCCPEYQECPVTVCKKVCYTEAVHCRVPVCRDVWKEEKVKVCKINCVEEKRVEKCTVYEQRKVPCKATRTVRVCVPYEETVTCCRMVPRTVTRQVPVCETDCCERGGLFSRLRHNADCCRPTNSCCH